MLLRTLSFCLSASFLFSQSASSRSMSSSQKKFSTHLQQLTIFSNRFVSIPFAIRSIASRTFFEYFCLMSLSIVASLRSFISSSNFFKVAVGSDSPLLRSALRSPASWESEVSFSSCGSSFALTLSFLSFPDSEGCFPFLLGLLFLPCFNPVQVLPCPVPTLSSFASLSAEPLVKEPEVPRSAVSSFGLMSSRYFSDASLFLASSFCMRFLMTESGIRAGRYSKPFPNFA